MSNFRNNIKIKMFGIELSKVTFRIKVTETEELSFEDIYEIFETEILNTKRYGSKVLHLIDDTTYYNEQNLHIIIETELSTDFAYDNAETIIKNIFTNIYK